MNLLYISSSRIGDAVLATGALKHFTDQHPGVSVTIATDPLPAPLFQRVPNLKRIIIFKKQPYKKHWFQLWQQLVGTSWDVIVDLRGSIIPYLLRGNQRYIWNSRDKFGHQVEKISQCIKVSPAPTPHIWLTSEDLKKATSLLQTELPVLAVSPAANWLGKQWPPEKFAKLINLFLEKNAAKIAVFAAPHEKTMIQPVLDAIPEEYRIDLIGSIDLLTVAACLKKSTVFIGNDSGLMHLSAAVQTPTIGLFGPTNDQEYGPWGEKNCVIRTPLSLSDIRSLPHFSYAKRNECYMEDLTVESVFETLQSRWNKAL